MKKITVSTKKHKTTADELVKLIKRVEMAIESGKLIRIDKHLGDHITLWSFNILDKNGNDIPYEMIMDDYNSDVFGNWFYDTNRTFCYKHLGDGIPDPNCMDCTLEDSTRRCVSHNQSMTFCKKCREFTIKAKLICPVDFKDNFIKISIEEHDKNLIKRKVDDNMENQS